MEEIILIMLVINGLLFIEIRMHDERFENHKNSTNLNRGSTLDLSTACLSENDLVD